MAVKDPKKRLAFEIDLADIQKATLSLRGLGSAIEDVARRKKKTGKIDGVEKFRANASRMMFNLFYKFAVDVYETAVSYTPEGDATRIATDKVYRRIYQIRQRDHGIPMTPGYHKGAWLFSLQKNAPFNKSVIGEQQARANFQSSLQSFYTTFRDQKFRGSVYISTIGPAYGLINAGIIKNAEKTNKGITKPTLDLIMQYYK